MTEPAVPVFTKAFNVMFLVYVGERRKKSHLGGYTGMKMQRSSIPAVINQPSFAKKGKRLPTKTL